MNLVREVHQPGEEYGPEVHAVVYFQQEDAQQAIHKQSGSIPGQYQQAACSERRKLRDQPISYCEN